MCREGVALGACPRFMKLSWAGQQTLAVQKQLQEERLAALVRHHCLRHLPQAGAPQVKCLLEQCCCMQSRARLQGCLTGSLTGSATCHEHESMRDHRGRDAVLGEGMHMPVCISCTGHIH